MLAMPALPKLWLSQRPRVCLLSAYRHSYHILWGDLLYISLFSCVLNFYVCECLYVLQFNSRPGQTLDRFWGMCGLWLLCFPSYFQHSSEKREHQKWLIWAPPWKATEQNVWNAASTPDDKDASNASARVMTHVEVHEAHMSLLQTPGTERPISVHCFQSTLFHQF